VPPDILKIEHAAEQPARRRADHHAARPGEGLQSRSEIRRFPDHGFFTRRALADQLADHDQPGRDTHARRERSITAWLQSTDCRG
jgi:hypothetical protein